MPALVPKKCHCHFLVGAKGARPTAKAARPTAKAASPTAKASGPTLQL